MKYVYSYQTIEDAFFFFFFFFIIIIDTTNLCITNLVFKSTLSQNPKFTSNKSPKKEKKKKNTNP